MRKFAADNPHDMYSHPETWAEWMKNETGAPISVFVDYAQTRILYRQVQQDTTVSDSVIATIAYLLNISQDEQ